MKKETRVNYTKVVIFEMFQIRNDLKIYHLQGFELGGKKSGGLTPPLFFFPSGQIPVNGIFSSNYGPERLKNYHFRVIDTPRAVRYICGAFSKIFRVNFFSKKEI
ncbi:MAG TPA: hypothetical protein VLB09_08450 [Nitrospiria bacterium]|nr:hypothetical protein [Nitrospiria bacterium]